MHTAAAVTTHFPHAFLPLLRCSRDGGSLALDSESRSDEVGVIDGLLRCGICGSEYRIEDGIARLMLQTLSAEEEHEITIRDKEDFYTQGGFFVPPKSGWRSELMDRVEIPAQLAALRPLGGRTVLELGCGDGRFTMLMATMEARVLAVDFSISALRQMVRWLPTGIAPTACQSAGRLAGTDLRGRVGLVQASINHLRVRPNSFDRALTSTPLDSREERMGMYRLLADALSDDGRLVTSVENDDPVRRALGLPLARRYSKGGILIEHFDAATLRREMGPYFLNLRIYPIRPKVPFVRRLPLAWGVRLSLVIGAIPYLRRLGELLLVRAEQPVRPPQEGQNRPGSRLAKWLFRRFTRAMGKAAVWGTDELVAPP
jgi:SAM-dependent methyltransferase